MFYKRAGNINTNFLKPTKNNLIYTFDFKHKFEYKFSLFPQVITIRKRKKTKKITNVLKEPQSTLLYTKRLNLPK